MAKPSVSSSRRTPWKGAKRAKPTTAPTNSTETSANGTPAQGTAVSAAPRRGGGYRRPSTVQEVDERAAAAAQRAEELAENLAAVWNGLSTAQGWRGWLDFATKFPQQSLDNTLLLLAQRPQATFVLGYEDWQALGRNVMKGEKGLQLLGPQPVAGGRRPAVRVWDIEQTAPIPGAAYTADAAGGRNSSRTVDPADVAPDDPVTRALTNLVQLIGYRVERGATGAQDAITDHAQRVITIASFTRDGHPDPRITLVREVAEILSSARSDEPADAGRVAFEATSVAYLVAARHGLPTANIVPNDESSTPPWRYTHPDGWSADETYFARQQQQRAEGRGFNPRAEEVLGPIRDEQIEAMARRVTATSAALSEAVNKALEPEATPSPQDQDLTRDLIHEAADLARAATMLRERVEVLAAAAEQRQQPQQPPAAEHLTPELQARAQQFRAMHAEASTFYREQLALASGPRSYLAQRGLTATVIADAGLGFAPAGWTSLTDHLRDRGYDDEALIASGLATRSRHGRGPLVDRFRNRIMFPVRDQEGRDVAFIGRAAPGEHDTAKYLNSPETLIYRKRELLYGLGDSRDDLAAGAPVAIVEGPLDRLGILSALERATAAAERSDDCSGGQLTYVPVSSCGTAVTPHQLALLDATHPLRDRRVMVGMDEDPAGRRAEQRLWPMLRTIGAWPEKIRWGADGDPAAQLVEQGPEAVIAALDQARNHPLVDSLIEWAVEPYEKRMGEAAVPLIAARACFAILREVPIEYQNTKLAAVLTRINSGADLPLDPVAFYEEFLQVTSPERVGEAWGRLEEHVGYDVLTDVLGSTVQGAAQPASRIVNSAKRAQLGQQSLRGSACVPSEPEGRDSAGTPSSTRNALQTR